MCVKQILGLSGALLCRHYKWRDQSSGRAAQTPWRWSWVLQGKDLLKISSCSALLQLSLSFSSCLLNRFWVDRSLLSTDRGFPFRSQLLESTIPNAGLKRTCWRSKEREPEPMTRRKAWWVLFLNWMLKVTLALKRYFDTGCSTEFFACVSFIIYSSGLVRCRRPTEEIRVSAWTSWRRLSLWPSYSASSTSACWGQWLIIC